MATAVISFLNLTWPHCFRQNAIGSIVYSHELQGNTLNGLKRLREVAVPQAAPCSLRRPTIRGSGNRHHVTMEICGRIAAELGDLCRCVRGSVLKTGHTNFGRNGRPHPCKSPCIQTGTSPSPAGWIPAKTRAILRKRRFRPDFPTAMPGWPESDNFPRRWAMTRYEGTLESAGSSKDNSTPTELMRFPYSCKRRD